MNRAVLVFDGNQRSALAVVRSLGKRGIHVVVGDETTPTLAGSSKYCQQSLVYPSPYSHPSEFIQAVRDFSNSKRGEILFPMSDVTTQLLLQYQEEFATRGIGITSAPLKVFETLTDKGRLCSLAQRLNIPTPVTRYITGPEGLESALAGLRFPVVLKPYRSRIFANGQWLSASVRYADSMRSLEQLVTGSEIFANHPFLLQEYVRGEGRGVFALYNQGQCLALFAHRRIREKPLSGGVSVLSESVPVDPMLGELSQRLLNQVQCHGVAMVEFKMSPDQVPYLMEVNARFWGSLQLAIDAGVDFPWLMYRMATKAPVEQVASYKIGIRNRWLLGDLDHLYLTLASRGSFAHKCRAVVRFVNPFGWNTRHEVNKWSDLRPFLFELKQYALEIVR